MHKNIFSLILEGANRHRVKLCISVWFMHYYVWLIKLCFKEINVYLLCFSYFDKILLHVMKLFNMRWCIIDGIHRCFIIWIELYFLIDLWIMGGTLYLNSRNVPSKNWSPQKEEQIIPECNWCTDFHKYLEFPIPPKWYTFIQTLVPSFVTLAIDGTCQSFYLQAICKVTLVLQLVVGHVFHPTQYVTSRSRLSLPSFSPQQVPFPGSACHLCLFCPQD